MKAVELFANIFFIVIYIIQILLFSKFGIELYNKIDFNKDVKSSLDYLSMIFIFFSILLFLFYVEFIYLRLFIGKNIFDKYFYKFTNTKYGSKFLVICFCLFFISLFIGCIIDVITWFI